MKQKKRFLGLLLVLTMMSSIISTISVQADTTSNPTSKIDLNKTVEKNQWGLNEEFTLNYTIQPRDIPQSLVPEALYHKNGADISLVIDKSGSMNWGIGGNSTLAKTISYVEDLNGTYIRFYNGSVSYYGTYSISNKNKILYNGTVYSINSNTTGKYINFNSTKYYLDLQKKYRQQQTTEKSRMDIVKEAANNFVDKFKNYSNVRIGLINYSTDATVKNSLIDQSGFDSVKSNISGIVPDGATNIGDGLRKSYWQLKDSSSVDKKKFIVLLTDGEPNKRSYYYKSYSDYYHDNRVSVGDKRDSYKSNYYYNYYDPTYPNYYGIDGDGNDDIGNYGLDYAKYIAGIVGADKENNVLNINPFMIAFSTSATTNKLAQISNIASSNQLGYYKEATTVEDINEVYEKISQTILSDLSIYGLQLEETFPTGISIVDKSNGLKIDSSNSKKIIGDIGNINYTLDTVNHVFKADPITFWVKLKGTATGDYVLGKNATGNSTSFVSYKDIDGKDVNPSPSFPPININIYNNQPPEMNALLANSVANNNYNLSVNVDKPSDIVIKALPDSSSSIASKNHTNYVQDGTNYTYNLENIPAGVIENNINSNIYNLSLEATDASNTTLKTKERVPLTSVTLVKSDINLDNLLIQTDINTKITEVKLNGNIILNDQVTDSDGKYSCNNVNLKDGNNVISVIVVNSYNNTTQIIKNINVDKAPPNITLVPATTAYTNNNVTVAVAITDASLISDERYAKADQSLPISYFSSNANNGMSLSGTSFQALENGVYTVYAKDSSGNESVMSITINNIDKIAPTGIISGNPTGPISEATLTLLASDTGGSGVKQIQMPGGTWVSGPTATYKVSQNNVYTFIVEDNAGNQQSVSCEVTKIATNMPKISIKTYDANGLRDGYDEQDPYKIPARIDKILNPRITLKGNAVAEIKVTDEKLKNVRYKFVTTQNMPSDGELIDINDSIKQEIIYPDLLKDQVGYLTARNYDVTNLPVKSNETVWNDKSQVFGNPSSIIEYRSANCANSVSEYISKIDGKFKNYSIFMNYLDLGNKGPYPDYKEAAKFWGYITPPETNDYYFGTKSDDGSQGYIIVDGNKIQIVDQFKIQGSIFKTDNQKMHLEKGKYYPIYLEYSNWGGDGEFRLLYRNTAFSGYNDQTGGITVPASWFRPSSNTNPGEVSTATFESTAVKGIPFPEQTSNYYLAFKAENEAGGVREGIYGPFLIDKTLPNATFTINPSTWTNSDVTITLNASDEHSGIKRIRKSAEEWVNGDSANYTVAENGIYTFEIEDNAGNVTIKTVNVSNIDKTPPDVTISSPIMDDNKVNNAEQKNVTISGKTEPNTAIKIIITDINGNKVEQTITSDSTGSYSVSGIDISGLAEGKLTVTAIVTDVAGNTSSVSKEIIKDTTAPSIPTLSATPTTPTNGNVIVTITYPNDAAIKEYKIGTSGEWIPYTGSVVIDTNCTIYARGQDEAGNTSEVGSLVISNIDKATPTAPIITLSTDEWSNRNVGVSITGSSAYSGIQKYQYKIGNGEWIDYSELEISNEGQTIIYARAVSNTGVIGVESSKTVKIDKTAPEAEIIKSTDAWTNQNIILTLTANDTPNGSGVKRVKKPDGTWVNGYSVTYTALESGSYTFEVEDNAGNTHTESVTITNIDKATIKTGLFINNKFSEKSSINIVKGFSTSLAFQITNLKNQQVKLEVSNTEFIRISDVKVYATTDLKNPITSVRVTVTGNAFTITGLSNSNNNYIFALKATALKVTTGPITDVIKINDFPRNEKHSINVVKLPPLQ